MGSRRASTSTELGDRVVDWFAEYAVHTKGRWAGKPFKLADWQADEIIRPLFGTLNPDGTRQFRTALIGTPRKAGKSTLGAAIALRLLFRDGEPGAEVYSAAADREQAAIVFEMARSMVEANEALASRAKVYRRAIAVPHTGATYKVLSADAYTKHGLSPSGVIFDELHAQPDRELWDVLTTGQGARSQPLTVAITTAGYDLNTICGELYDYGRRIDAGLVDDPTFFFRWWGAPTDADWRDETVWERAHPGLGISVSKEFLRGEARQAEALPARQNTFRRLYLNQWTRQDTRWMDLAAWDASAGLVSEARLEGKTCFAGLELGQRSEIAAFVLLFPVEDRFELLWRFFVPADVLADLDRVTAGAASGWVRAGFLQVTEGNEVDYGAIRRQVLADARRFDISQIGFVRHGARQLAQQLQDEDLLLVEVALGVTLASATQEFGRLAATRHLIHGGHAVARYMVDVLSVKQDGNGNVWPSKLKSKGPISGPLAAILALDRFMRAEPPKAAPAFLGSA